MDEVTGYDDDRQPSIHADNTRLPNGRGDVDSTRGVSDDVALDSPARYRRIYLMANTPLTQNYVFTRRHALRESLMRARRVEVAEAVLSNLGPPRGRDAEAWGPGRAQPQASTVTVASAASRGPARVRAGRGCA
jgi:hypothetical protein